MRCCWLWRTNNTGPRIISATTTSSSRSPEVAGERRGADLAQPAQRESCVTPHALTMEHAPIPFLDLGAGHAELRTELDAAWQRVFASDRLILGPEVEAFEAEFAAYCG